MKRICAWCGKDLGTTDDASESEYDVSHGICSTCEAKLNAQMDDLDEAN